MAYNREMALKSIINHPKDGNSPVSFRVPKDMKLSFYKLFPKRGLRSRILKQLLENYLCQLNQNKNV